MDSLKLKPSSASKKSKLVGAISKIMHLQPSSINSNFQTQKPNSHDKFNCWQFDQEEDEGNFNSRNLAAMEAFIAKLFAGVSSIKAAYAELQSAQIPYNGDVIQSADTAIVNELKLIYELKRNYMKKQLENSPHVTLLLAEMKEQHSIMKIYQIALKKMEIEAQSKDSDINLLKEQLDVALSTNKSIEKKLNSSGCFSILAGVCLPDLNPSHFIHVLHYTSRSVRSFVKLMMREMDLAGWDLDKATDSIVPDVVFAKRSHQCFAFEAFVWRNMIMGFNSPSFSLSDEQKHENHHFFEEFKRLGSVNPKQFLSLNLNSDFSEFVRTKYLNLVHPKLEYGLFQNLNQRELVKIGKCPKSGFYTAFLEMAERFWMLHCLGFSFQTGIVAFQVIKGCRFSEVYMESVSEEMFYSPAGEFQVSFMVLPGFKIGKSVIQCQVYLSR